MSSPLFRYGAPLLSFGCIAFVITRASLTGCAPSDVVVHPEPSAPSESTQVPSATESAGLASVPPSATPTAAETAAASQQPPDGIGEWGGLTKSGRMISPRIKNSVANPPQAPQTK